MWNIFKRKEKKESNWIEMMVNYIEAARKLGWEDETIKEKFISEKYPIEVIDAAFKIIGMKGGKMAKKEKYEEEDEDSIELDEEEDTEDEEDKEVERPKKKIERPIEKVETKGLTVEQKEAILLDHETRIRNLESLFYRIKATI